MLGFSDLTSFSRAFKGWAGMPPRQYRKECPKPGRPSKAARTRAADRKRAAAKRKAVRTKRG
jgi:AraC-like DNA-binding protein